MERASSPPRDDERILASPSVKRLTLTAPGRFANSKSNSISNWITGQKSRGKILEIAPPELQSKDGNSTIEGDERITDSASTDMFQRGRKAMKSISKLGKISKMNVGASNQSQGEQNEEKNMEMDGKHRVNEELWKNMKDAVSLSNDDPLKMPEDYENSTFNNSNSSLGSSNYSNQEETAQNVSKQQRMFSQTSVSSGLTSPKPSTRKLSSLNPMTLAQRGKSLLSAASSSKIVARDALIDSASEFSLDNDAEQDEEEEEDGHNIVSDGDTTSESGLDSESDLSETNSISVESFSYSSQLYEGRSHRVTSRRQKCRAYHVQREYGLVSDDLMDGSDHSGSKDGHLNRLNRSYRSNLSVNRGQARHYNSDRNRAPRRRDDHPKQVGQTLLDSMDSLDPSDISESHNGELQNSDDASDDDQVAFDDTMHSTSSRIRRTSVTRRRRDRQHKERDKDTATSPGQRDNDHSESNNAEEFPGDDQAAIVETMNNYNNSRRHAASPAKRQRDRHLKDKEEDHIVTHGESHNQDCESQNPQDISHDAQNLDEDQAANQNHSRRHRATSTQRQRDRHPRDRDEHPKTTPRERQNENCGSQNAEDATDHDQAAIVERMNSHNNSRRHRAASTQRQRDRQPRDRDEDSRRSHSERHINDNRDKSHRSEDPARRERKHKAEHRDHRGRRHRSERLDNGEKDDSEQRKKHSENGANRTTRHQSGGLGDHDRDDMGQTDNPERKHRSDHREIRDKRRQHERPSNRDKDAGCPDEDKKHHSETRGNRERKPHSEKRNNRDKKHHADHQETRDSNRDRKHRSDNRDVKNQAENGTSSSSPRPKGTGAKPSRPRKNFPTHGPRISQSGNTRSGEKRTSSRRKDDVDGSRSNGVAAEENQKTRGKNMVALPESRAKDDLSATGRTYSSTDDSQTRNDPNCLNSDDVVKNQGSLEVEDQSELDELDGLDLR